MSTPNLSSLSSVADPVNQLVWLDLEVSIAINFCSHNLLEVSTLLSSQLTGLEVESDHILEAACIVTDGDLNVVAECPLQVIHWPDDILNNMTEWPKEHHQKVA